MGSIPCFLRPSILYHSEAPPFKRILMRCITKERLEIYWPNSILFRLISCLEIRLFDWTEMLMAKNSLNTATAFTMRVLKRIFHYAAYFRRVCL